jgi:hypothetical protein
MISSISRLRDGEISLITLIRRIVVMIQIVLFHKSGLFSKATLEIHVRIPRYLPPLPGEGLALADLARADGYSLPQELEFPSGRRFTAVAGFGSLAVGVTRHQ